MRASWTTRGDRSLIGFDGWGRVVVSSMSPLYSKKTALIIYQYMHASISLAFEVAVRRNSITGDPPGCAVTLAFVLVAVDASFVTIFTDEGQHLVAGRQDLDVVIDQVQRLGIAVRALL